MTIQEFRQSIEQIFKIELDRENQHYQYYKFRNKEFRLKKKLYRDARYGPEFSEEDEKHLPFLISFSNYLGNGNMFCFHSENKEIYYFDHDEKPYLTKILIM